jgi:hypothetical protein
MDEKLKNMISSEVYWGLTQKVSCCYDEFHSAYLKKTKFFRGRIGLLRALRIVAVQKLGCP